MLFELLIWYEMISTTLMLPYLLSFLHHIMVGLLHVAYLLDCDRGMHGVGFLFFAFSWRVEKAPGRNHRRLASPRSQLAPCTLHDDNMVQ